MTVTFDVDFYIRAVVDEHNTRRYVGAAFDSVNDMKRFIELLKSSEESAFAELSAVRVILPDLAVGAEVLREDDPETLGTDITVGVATVSVAGAALFAVAVYMLTKRKSRSQKKSQTTPSSDPDQEKVLSLFDENEMMVDIPDKPDADVSTLGDPIPQGMAVTPGPMEVSLADETQSLPYDYKVAAHVLPSLDESGSYSAYSDVGSNIIDVQTDDDTLDAQYFIEDRIEVDAPPGLLGLILEADAEGIATVYDMKELSPLSDRVHLGDKLVSVDGLDVTVLPVKSVMKLIASKQANRVRRLVFKRVAKKFMSQVIQQDE
jgi:hypothetical protein